MSLIGKLVAKKVQYTKEIKVNYSHHFFSGEGSKRRRFF